MSAYLNIIFDDISLGELLKSVSQCFLDALKVLVWDLILWGDSLSIPMAHAIQAYNDI